MFSTSSTASPEACVEPEGARLHKNKPEQPVVWFLLIRKDLTPHTSKSQACDCLDYYVQSHWDRAWRRSKTPRPMPADRAERIRQYFERTQECWQICPQPRHVAEYIAEHAGLTLPKQ